MHEITSPSKWPLFIPLFADTNLFTENEVIDLYSLNYSKQKKYKVKTVSSLGISDELP